MTPNSNQVIRAFVNMWLTKPGLIPNLSMQELFLLAYLNTVPKAGISEVILLLSKTILNNHKENSVVSLTSQISNKLEKAQLIEKQLDVVRSKISKRPMKLYKITRKGRAVMAYFEKATDNLIKTMVENETSISEE